METVVKRAIRIRLIIICSSLIQVLNGGDEDAAHLILRMERAGVGDGRPLGLLADVERTRPLSRQDHLRLETSIIHSDLVADAGRVLPAHTRVLRSRERAGVERRTATFLGNDAHKQVRHDSLLLYVGEYSQ